VIELRVFETQGQDSKEWTDITLKHNATFILCASLENARPIARGRVHTPTNIASLQGVNFAGTNYLERPKQAGYFIFPDLSVRNEGWYRLSFSLLEGTKEARDADPERQFPPSPRPQADGEPKAPLNFEDMATRLEVRSRPFQVFSAKKFPGLSESTELSRLVADQGCRVRIRRDVRMRKHGTRKDDGDSYEGERRSISRFPTPDIAYPQTPMERPRSISRASMDGSQHGFDHYRRASGEIAHFGQHYPSGSTAMGSAAPSPIAPYPAPPGTMAATANGHSYQSYSHPAASMPPVAMPSNGFAVPPLRHSMDNTTSGYTNLPSRSSFHSLPIPAALPRSITPEIPKLMPSHSLPPLSITNLTNPTSVSPSYDSVRKQWIIPGESGPAKRSYSPNGSHTQSQPLKAGMRPDSLQNISSYTTTGFMEADQFPYGDDSDDSSDLSHTGTMRYKRANGTTGRKHVPQIHNTQRSES
jgi:Velvet factor